MISGSVTLNLMVQLIDVMCKRHSTFSILQKTRQMSDTAPPCQVLQPSLQLDNFPHLISYLYKTQSKNEMLPFSDEVIVIILPQSPIK